MELKPAILYSDEIKCKSQELYYTDDMLYYSGFNGAHSIDVAELDENCNRFQWAVIDDGKLVGYISYYIEWYSLCASRFGLISFERNNPAIGYALRNIMNLIINKHKIHRIEWRCVGGNPVQRHYDAFCQRYNGRRLELRDVLKDAYGEYHNEYIYEIIL